VSDPEHAPSKRSKSPRQGKAARQDKRIKRAKGPHMGSIPERVVALDPHLYGFIHSQSSPADRRSLLALHSACAQAYKTFTYLEIGSHRGGSLQSLVVDERCTQIVSVDLRPETTPDDRGKLIAYPGNSTQRMLDDLSAIPGADLRKLQTIDAATPDIDPASVTVTPALSFIDGEHTYRAALQDARFCRAVMGGHGCIVFHDIDIVAGAASDFIADLRRDGIEPVAYPLPDQLFAVEMPPGHLHCTPAIQELVHEPQETFSPVARYLSRSTADRSEERALVLEQWLTLGIGRTVRSRADKRATRLRLKELRRVAGQPRAAKGDR
jgi:Methyltransferase domain